MLPMSMNPGDKERISKNITVELEEGYEDYYKLKYKKEGILLPITFYEMTRYGDNIHFIGKNDPDRPKQTVGVLKTHMNLLKSGAKVRLSEEDARKLEVWANNEGYTFTDDDETIAEKNADKYDRKV